MAVIIKKTWPRLFEDVLTGRKKFDLRVNDFEVKEGDTLILEEWNPKTKQYTGRKVTKTVSYILKMKPDSFGQEEEVKSKGIIVMQLD